MRAFGKDAVDVCVITTIHPPFDARIYDRELMAIVGGGFRAAFVSTWDRPGEPNGVPIWITLPPLRSRKDRFLHGYRTFRAAMKVEARSYHFHDIDFILWALLLKVIKRVPVVYDCHENYAEEILYNKTWIAPALRKPLAWITRVVEDFSVRRFKFVIVPVPNLVERFTALGADVTLVRNLAKFSPRRELVHRRGLICPGTLSPANGMRVLLGIAEEIKCRGLDLPLTVSDRFPTQALRDEFISRVEAGDLNVKIAAPVLPRDMDRLLSEADIGLSVEQDVPNMRMGFHTKLFEYMAMGMPVVASDVWSNAHLVGAGDSGIIVAPDDPKAYVDAVERLYADPESFSRFRENGFRAIETQFNWDLEKGHLVALWRHILGDLDRDAHAGASA